MNKKYKVIMEETYPNSRVRKFENKLEIYALHRFFFFEDIELFIWECLENGLTNNEILELIDVEYDVSVDEVKSDLNCFIEELISAKLILEVGV